MGYCRKSCWWSREKLCAQGSGGEDRDWTCHLNDTGARLGLWRCFQLPMVTAFQQHFLYHAEAQRRPIIQPDSVRDDLGGETMALVTGKYGLHGYQLISEHLPRRLRHKPDTTTRFGLTRRSDTTSRSHYKIPVAKPARHREESRKTPTTGAPKFGLRAQREQG